VIGGASDLAGFNADPNKANVQAQLQNGNSALITAEGDIKIWQEAVVSSTKSAADSSGKDLFVVTAAQAAVKKAILDYASAMQSFTIDAGKSVTKLTTLRQETVKYYEAQKQLADLMSTSAANLRGTVASYQYNQLTPEQQLASLQSQFSSSYSMANATQGDGATLAGYADKLNATLTPLIAKLDETGHSSLISNYLAQAESVAALIDKAIPVNYQQDSLNMLGSIDATLAALDASSQSAERIIADAVAAGADRTAAGLKTVGEAITGHSLPAFASGGSFGGGLRIVGENGPELEATGPSRIFNANQTRSMLSGGGNSDAVVAELRALRQEVEGLRSEARATAVNTNGINKTLTRVTPDGNSLQTVAAV